MRGVSGVAGAEIDSCDGVGVGDVNRSGVTASLAESCLLIFFLR